MSGTGESSGTQSGGGLAEAGRAADTLPATGDPRSSTAGCSEPRGALQVVVVGKDDLPVAGVAVRLLREDGKASDQKTDARGLVHYGGVPRGPLKLTLPALDRGAWELVATESLPPEPTAGEGDRQWHSPEGPPQPAGPYKVQPGDCLAAIAYRVGMTEEEIWQDPANAALRDSRDSPYVLAPGDLLNLPAKRPGLLETAAGQRLRIRLLNAPIELKIRFLTAGLAPRRQVPYLLKLEGPGGSPLEDRERTTDDAGLLVEAIPPETQKAELWLGKGLDREVLPLALGHVDPIDSVSGMQARLNNLSYPCGPEDGKHGDHTRAALRRFQADRSLKETGEADPKTREKLLELHGS